MAREFFIYSPTLCAWVRQSEKTFATLMAAAMEYGLDGKFLEVEQPEPKVKVKVMEDVVTILVKGRIKFMQARVGGWQDAVDQWLDRHGYKDEPVTWAWEAK
jgi:hypothetical protein